MSTQLLTDSPAWKALQSHHKQVAGLQLRELFVADPKRGEKFTAEACGLYLDYSKNRVTGQTLELLLALADERGLRERIDASGRSIDLEVDGGINVDTAREAVAAGADVLVAGTASFSGGQAAYAANLRRIRGG